MGVLAAQRLELVAGRERARTSSSRSGFRRTALASRPGRKSGPGSRAPLQRTQRRDERTARTRRATRRGSPAARRRASRRAPRRRSACRASLRPARRPPRHPAQRGSRVRGRGGRPTHRRIVMSTSCSSASLERGARRSRVVGDDRQDGRRRRPPDRAAPRAERSSIRRSPRERAAPRERRNSLPVESTATRGRRPQRTHRRSPAAASAETCGGPSGLPAATTTSTRPGVAASRPDVVSCANGFHRPRRPSFAPPGRPHPRPPGRPRRSRSRLPHPGRPLPARAGRRRSGPRRAAGRACRRPGPRSRPSRSCRTAAGRWRLARPRRAHGRRRAPTGTSSSGKRVDAREHERECFVDPEQVAHRGSR